MPKRPLSPSPHDSSSSSSTSAASTRSLQRRSRFQLLHGLPASLLSSVCSFLSVNQTVCILRSTCRALHDDVTADCLLQSRLVLSRRSLPALVASTPRTRALVSRVPSLTILYQLERGDMCALPLQELRCPVDASRFLLSSLSSLQVVFELGDDWPDESAALAQRCLLSVVQLLTANVRLCSSLRRLAIDGICLERDDSSLLSLPPLPALTHFRLDVEVGSFTCSPLVSALSATAQSLTFLDLHWTKGSTALLRLLCTEAATPLLLRLNSLVLPCDSLFRKATKLHDAFLCRLSSLPAPPVLQQLAGVPRVSYRAAGLLSLFSLPHLRLLELRGDIRRCHLSAFVAGFTSAPAALVSLLFPRFKPEYDEDGRERRGEAEDAAALCSVGRLLLSRITALRRLCCQAEMASAAVALPHCSGSHFSLTMRRSALPRFRFTAPLSFPLLTELIIEAPMQDAELELLLSRCPQLFKLDCAVFRSWKVLLIAARCCRRLLELTVWAHWRRRCREAIAEPQSDISGPFLPQLVRLELFVDEPQPQPFVSAFAVLLQRFTEPPHAQLRHVHLVGLCLTAQHLLCLARLPQLSHLLASSRIDERRGFADVEQARARMRQQLRSTGAAGHTERDAGRPLAYREDWEVGVNEPPLGPHQQQEMRRRLLQQAAACWRWTDHALDFGDGVDGDAMRAVFFAELRSVLTCNSCNQIQE